MIIYGPTRSSGRASYHYTRHRDDCKIVKNNKLTHTENRDPELRIVDCRVCINSTRVIRKSHPARVKITPKILYKKGESMGYTRKKAAKTFATKRTKILYPQTATKKKIGRAPVDRLVEQMEKHRPDLFAVYQEANFLVKPLILEQFKDERTLQVGHHTRLYRENRKEGSEFDTL